MSISDIRQQLHQYIETADERKIQAMFTLLESNPGLNARYTSADIATFYSHYDKVLKGETETFTAEEALEWIRKQKDSDGLNLPPKTSESLRRLAGDSAK